MALIQAANDGRKDGGYSRIFGDSDLGALISKTHATSISAGTELERLISTTHGNLMTAAQLGDFLTNKLPAGVYVMGKKLIKEHLKAVIQSQTEPDFVVIVIVDNKVYVVEMKDGDTFDTKKAAGEVTAAKNFAALLHTYLLQHKVNYTGIPYTVEVRFCSFNQNSKVKIVDGLKREISLKEAMTGDEFCKLIGISYSTIRAQRDADQVRNLDYFISELLAIPTVALLVQEKLTQSCYPTSTP